MSIRIGGRSGNKVLQTHRGIVYWKFKLFRTFQMGTEKYKKERKEVTRNTWTVTSHSFEDWFRRLGRNFTLLFTAENPYLNIEVTYLFININQLDPLNFIISLFQASTFFEEVWWYQRLYNTILSSWRWAHVLETCRGLK